MERAGRGTPVLPASASATAARQTNVFARTAVDALERSAGHVPHCADVQRRAPAQRRCSAGSTALSSLSAARLRARNLSGLPGRKHRELAEARAADGGAVLRQQQGILAAIEMMQRCCANSAANPPVSRSDVLANREKQSAGRTRRNSRQAADHARCSGCSRKYPWSNCVRERQALRHLLDHRDRQAGLMRQRANACADQRARIGPARSRRSHPASA